MRSEFWQKIVDETGEENGKKLPFFSLAPMEAVTDVVFRHVVANATRPDVFYTEFTNSSSFASPKGIHSTRGRLAFTEDEQPLVAQIWGSNPEHIKYMASELPKLGYKAIDINMGCPDKAVIKSGGGSDLIRNPELAHEIIIAAQESGLPITVKTRLGFSFVDEWRNWLKFILEHNIEVLTIHLRTRKEMSKVDAHYELIDEICELRDQISPNTLIQINGDIKNRQHGLDIWRQHQGIDGFMIGRGIFHNPFAFEKEAKEHSREELLNLLFLHLDLFEKYCKELEPRRYEPLKRFFKIYVREFNGASELREKLMQTKNIEQAREILKEFTDATEK